MENTRRNFAVSLAASMLAVWLYFGCPPLGPAPSPLAEGSLSNLLAKIAAIPLTLAIFGGGGLAAARALGDVSDDAAAREADRRLLALAAPPGITWILMAAVTAFSLGPVGDTFVVVASTLAVIDILRNAWALGVFRHPDASGNCRQDDR